MKVAVIGAGWAGMAAAVAKVQAGHEVTVLEAARTIGGRARAVPAVLPDGTPATLDNGQHILIGAYTECLRLMRLVGVPEQAALVRLPLSLRFPDGQGLQLPDLPPPFDALVGIARARGWSWSDKLSLLRAATAWQLRGFRCAPHATVADLCAPLSPKLLREFIDPLCVSALNTPAREASGRVFLRVLKDSLFSGRGGSNLLIPRTDLGTLFPESAARWLAERSAQIHTGSRVRTLHRTPECRWQLDLGDNAWPGYLTVFDQIVLACPPWEAQRLVGTATGLEPDAANRATAWAAQARSLRFTAIATVYTQSPGVRLPAPMVALHSSAQAPAQFVFDRSQLGGPEGLLAWVVSDSPTDARETLEARVCAQARAVLSPFGLTPGDALPVVRTVVEKRATFACTPGLVRPARQVLPGVQAWGDYVEGPYPATLEGAVRGDGAVA